MLRSRSQVRILWTLLAAAVGLVFILPAAWMFLGAFRPGNAVIDAVTPLSWNTFWPDVWTLDNFVQMLGPLDFGRALINSLIVVVVSVIVGVAVSALAAYGFSVVEFRGREIVFGLVVVGFLIPFESIAVPLAQIFNDAGLNNTYIGLILPGIGSGLAIFYLRQHFLGIPASIREAALIDGAGEFSILRRMYLPLSTPALANAALIIFLSQWMAYLWPLLIAPDPALQVAPIALSKTFTLQTSNFGQNFAGALMISLIPAIIMFVLQMFSKQSIAEAADK
ncbi:carbohydrate ABC transporter permease [Homoserinimonas sp. OAct 916]|uniref:carbohydrate ABC transporter permease n=1 Tax=Homoserinimonas sp. OAct 916 TaxID=2211450 RepID=UPI000DBE4303|nr:carbohydrate ABC transporter permease [Homoserinimonas sp. OAct 916]